jgi:hypothetical protein
MTKPIDFIRLPEEKNKNFYDANVAQWDDDFARAYNTCLSDIVKLNDKEISVEKLASLLQEQDLLDGDILKGKSISVLSMSKCTNIANAILTHLTKKG